MLLLLIRNSIGLIIHIFMCKLMTEMRLPDLQKRRIKPKLIKVYLLSGHVIENRLKSQGYYFFFISAYKIFKTQGKQRRPRPAASAVRFSSALFAVIGCCCDVVVLRPR